MKVKEVETLLNLSRANIRFYERQGLVKPTRQENRYRDYDEEDIRRLIGIAALVLACVAALLIVSLLNARFHFWF